MPAHKALLGCSTVMVVGAKHGGISVGEVESQHTDEVRGLMIE
jgi:hypothetical protein